jgi:hypothetical protein
MSTLKVDTIQDTNAVEMYLCKAWVNFNGQGTVAIRDSGNISSVIDTATGVYTVSFTNAMPDADYSAVVSASDAGTTRAWPHTKTFSTGSFVIRNSRGDTGADVDHDLYSVAVFR